MAKMLTTRDNFINPFDDFTAWLLYDNVLGHNTCELVDRMMEDTSTYSPKEVEEARLRAYQKIIETDPIGIYVIIDENTNIKDINDIKYTGEGV